MSSEDIFKDVLPSVLEANLSSTSLGSTPIEFSGVVGAAPPQNKATTSKGDNAFHECPECSKVLKTKSGLARHFLLHKLNEYNSRKPLEEEIRSTLKDNLKCVMADIGSETAVSEMGLEKKKFLDSFSFDSCSAFLEALSSDILKIVVEKIKVMPPFQYEETLKKLNHLLSDPSYYEKMRDNLLICVPDDAKQISSRVVQRLIWRITSKLMLKVQADIFQKMKKLHVAAFEEFKMSDKDLELFKEHIGRILRATYRFGVKSDNSVWKMRCLCLREKIVTSAGDSDEFLDKKLWQSKKIVLTETCVNIFLGLERIIQDFQTKNCPYTSEIVFNSLTREENLVILNSMRMLSQGLLSEDVAIDFLYDLIKSLTSLSGKLDAKKKLDKVKRKQKTSNVSLRTNLKRDPKTANQEPSPTSACEKEIKDHSAGTSQKATALKGQTKRRAAAASTAAASTAAASTADEPVSPKESSTQIEMPHPVRKSSRKRTFPARLGQ